MVSLLVSLTYTFLFFVSSVFTPTIQLISIISLILFATNVGLLARNSFAALLRYLFVVVMLFFGIFSSVVIDFNQGAFLPEIGKTIYLNHSVAALFGIYASLILNILCFRFSPNIFNYDSITMPHSLNQLFINVFNKSLFLIPFLGATLFLLEGLPFFLGLSHRLNFYNTVSSFWNTFFILLDLCSVLLGYLYYKNGKDYTWQFLIVILLIRILSLQKFTELILSITLFLSFAALIMASIKPLVYPSYSLLSVIFLNILY